MCFVNKGKIIKKKKKKAIVTILDPRALLFCDRSQKKDQEFWGRERNRELLARVYPRLVPTKCICFEF